MKISTADFLIGEGKNADLRKRPTKIAPYYASKEEYQEILEDQVSELSNLQELFYASNRNAMLLIFQGMDAAGKDGLIKHVMSGVNPQGCQVVSFKQPSTNDMQHDFLWRTTCALPERGKIGIFNRSYYEDVLISRVHPEILPVDTSDKPLNDASGDDIWHHRHRSIVNHETHLYENGTRVIKFFLHLSKEEQRKRFLERIDQPAKNWKLSLADIEERKYWKQYLAAYEAGISATSTENAPWYVIPADDKLNARIIVSRIVLHALESYKMSFPKVDAKRRRELQMIRKQLVK